MGAGGHCLPKGFKKRKIIKYGVFSCIRVKFASLSSLTRKYMHWEGFYHNFSTKKASELQAALPWPPSKGLCCWTPLQWTPEVVLPPLTMYPAAAPTQEIEISCGCKKVLSKLYSQMSRAGIRGGPSTYQRYCLLFL